MTASLPGTGGRLTTRSEDFVVDEIPAYEPEGSGDHWFVRIQKTDVSTPRLCTLMAEAAGIHIRDIGVAGRKDERAVTTQWLSLPTEPVPPEDPRIIILEQARHRHKLRRGHLKGNRFRIRLGGLHPDAEQHLPELIEQVSLGVPNYFGDQRFGYEGSSLSQALAFIAKPRRRVRDPRFLVSILQSALFNAWLGSRVKDGLFHQAVTGDILRKRETGGLFICEEAAVDTERVQQGLIEAMGPLYGPKMMHSADVSAEREEVIRAQAEFHAGAWKSMARFGPGGRRVSRVAPTAFNAVVEGSTLLTDFILPSGCYATTVLSELAHPEGGRLTRSDSLST